VQCVSLCCSLFCRTGLFLGNVPMWHLLHCLSLFQCLLATKLNDVAVPVQDVMLANFMDPQQPHVGAQVVCRWTVSKVMPTRLHYRYCSCKCAVAWRRLVVATHMMPKVVPSCRRHASTHVTLDCLSQCSKGRQAPAASCHHAT
jgi:hypothetical protein